MFPKIKTTIPGPKSRLLMSELAEYESPAITARTLKRAAVGGLDCPIVWAKTADLLVEDVDGNTYLDFTAGFGVAGVGHAHPRLVKAAQEQMARMPHAMGDAFPGENKVRLAKALAELVAAPLKRTLFANAGFEAVEAALKTAMIKTGKAGVIAFEDAYHGLGYGALAVTSYRERFREPFLAQLNPHIKRLPYPQETEHFPKLLEKTIQESEIGALIIEPILGRGGIVEAPHKAMQQIREITKAYNVVMIVDEICTGFGRTGPWFAIEEAGVVPDILCLGKGMNGGFPISAAIGTDEVMAGWGDAQGEALHTSTFLGNPVGCAMALACIDVLKEGLRERVPLIGDYFKKALLALQSQVSSIKEVRGRGLMLGVEFEHPNSHYVLLLSEGLLQAGIIALPCGVKGNILSFTPPFTVQKEQIDFLCETLMNLIKEKALCL